VKPIVIESPLGSRPDGTRCGQAEYERNVEYLDACILDSLRRGEAPFASHGLYPGPLNDAKPDERKLGMEAGFVIASALHAGADAPRVFYMDRGETPGMAQGRIQAERIGQKVLERRLGGEWSAS
jgi:hypothetical protein